MKYQDLIESANRYTYRKEPRYFAAIADLKEVRRDLTKLNDAKHLMGIVKPFLIKWGRMGRVVGRKGLDWKGLGDRLRSSEKSFGALRAERFRTVDFRSMNVSDAVKGINGKLDDLEYLGSPTTISKILHVLNPEIFVMWDIGIRKKYRCMNNRIRDDSGGYLQFLRESQKEIWEALSDRRKQTGQGFDEIESEIRNIGQRKTLAKIVDEYNYGAINSF